jgi:hypothetical protein
MSGRQNPIPDRPGRLYRELTREKHALDRGCRQVLNASADMFRTAKYAFYIVTLGFTTYLIEAASVDPLVAMTFAALLISGPEAVEAWLIRLGELKNVDTPPAPDAAETPPVRDDRSNVEADAEAEADRE